MILIILRFLISLTWQLEALDISDTIEILELIVLVNLLDQLEAFDTSAALETVGTIKMIAYSPGETY